MGSFSLLHWAIVLLAVLLVVLLVVLLLFGAGKLPSIMGDFAKGIRSFKAGLKDGDAKGTDISA